MGKFVNLVFVVCIFSTNLFAIPVEWKVEDGGNGHWYDLISTPLTWDNANIMAGSMSCSGMDGHLVTITSQAENIFVTDEIMAGIAITAWAGGYQPLGSSEPDGNWQWVTGESWIYQNWRSLEPNNNGDENVLEVYASDTWASGKWNDHSATPSQSYIVEYSVPEPATLLLLGLGGLVLRKKQKA